MTQVRYKKSSEPFATDGRDISASVAVLSGEAATQEAEGAPDEHIKSIARTWVQLPEPRRPDPTYYERPMLKESVWTWAIPAYYFVGGLSGAALVLAAAAQLRKSEANERLSRRCHWIAFVGLGVSAALLIYDLGRPMRFLNMLRVFRPTSPMNMGAWILTGSGVTTSAALLLRMLPGLGNAIGEAAGYAAGLFGAALATYTGVLVANTAVPVWQESRRMLPVLFGASAISSVGSAFEMFVTDPEEQAISKAFGIAGQGAELAASIVMEKQASAVPRVRRPFRRGVSGFLWRTAQCLTAASFLLSVLPKRTPSNRNRQIALGALGIAGSLLMRVSVERAGNASARDARASFHLQRAGAKLL